MKFSSALSIAGLSLVSGVALAQNAPPPASPPSQTAVGGVSIAPARPALSARGMQLPDPMKMADERLAETKVQLNLTAEQEKSWPAIETAVKALYKLQVDQMHAMMNRAHQGQSPMDPLEAVVSRADMMAATASAMKSIVVASKPLAAKMTLEQKIRLADLSNLRMMPSRPPGAAPVAGQPPHPVAPPPASKP